MVAHDVRLASQTLVLPRDHWWTLSQSVDDVDQAEWGAKVAK